MVKLFDLKIMLISPKQSLARFSTFFEVAMTIYTVICILFLYEGTGQSLRKDDSCDSTLAIYNVFFLSLPTNKKLIKFLA